MSGDFAANEKEALVTVGSAYKERVALIQRNFQDPQERGSALKAAEMLYTAERRHIVGALTPREEARLSAILRSNYTGKPVTVDVNGEVVRARIITNPFGLVKVELETGRVVTVKSEKVSA